VRDDRIDWPLALVDDGSLSRVVARIPDARRLDPEALSSSVCEAYTSIHRLVSSRGQHAIRYWNFVPGIGERIGDLDRYMVFNRGRYAAFMRARDAQLDGRSPVLPTSSAVGVGTEDLVIECLAADAAGVPVENPRQRSAWNYSPCYGPRPPCFARATIARIDGRTWLLIGGTASVVGEESRHERDIEGQIAETFDNLTALIDAACRVLGLGSDPRDAENDDYLEQIVDARVYVAQREDANVVAAAVPARLPNADVELAFATVCRPELLVEIEGRACLRPQPA
jgi:chorismate lyase/3-hydroxybenzoate synthase